MVPHWMLAVAGTLAGCVGSQSTNGGPDIRGEISLETVLDWLPMDTESIIAAPSFEVPRTQETQDVPATLLKLSTVGALFTPGLKGPPEPGPVLAAMRGSRLRLGLKAARRFTFPHSIGSVLYEGCDIAIFEDTIAAKSVWNALKTNRQTQLKSMPQETLIFEETLEGVRWTFYITRPRENVLLCATNERYLKEVLSRMGGSAKDSFAESFKGRQEWKVVDHKASPVWSIRVFRPESIGTDPWFSLSHDPDARGAGFSVSEDEKTLRGWYFTDALDALDIGTRLLPRQAAGRGKVELIAPGTVRFEFDLTQPEETGVALWIADCMSGHLIIF